jgi:hypothetical protein
MKRIIKEVLIKDIDLDTSQPRQTIEHDKMQDLADDMEEAGQIVPIILTYHYKKPDGSLVIGKDAVKNKNSRWFVIDGYRRILAAKDFLGWDKIDAEIRPELSELDVYETQFRVGSKRVHISVTEMAKAIERYAKTWKKEGKKGNIVKRLSQLTGYSSAYFDMANDIVTEKDKGLKKMAMEGKSPYIISEIKHASRDESIRSGMKEAVVEHHKKTGKSPGALLPRKMTHMFRKLEADKTKTNKQKKAIAKAKTFEELNKSNEIEDTHSEFDTYLFDIETFYNRIRKQWNLKGISKSQKKELIDAVIKISNYLKKGK